MKIDTTRLRHAWPLLFALIALALLGSGCAKKTAWGSAPDFTYTAYDGKPGKLSSFAGKPVVLNFWADW